MMIALLSAATVAGSASPSNEVGPFDWGLVLISVGVGSFWVGGWQLLYQRTIVENSTDLWKEGDTIPRAKAPTIWRISTYLSFVFAVLATPGGLALVTISVLQQPSNLWDVAIDLTIVRCVILTAIVVHLGWSARFQLNAEKTGRTPPLDTPARRRLWRSMLWVSIVSSSVAIVGILVLVLLRI